MGSLQQAKQSVIDLNTPSGEMLVTYLHQEESGMSYVSAQPMSIVLTTVNIYRNIMLLVIAVSLIVGLLLCCHQARKLSAPIVSLVHASDLSETGSHETLHLIKDMMITLRLNNERLTRLSNEHRALLRSSFTSRLLKGNFASSTEALRICQYICPEHAKYTTARALLLHLSPAPQEHHSATQFEFLGTMKLALKDVLESVFPTALSYDLDEETLALVLFDQDREEIDSLYSQMLSVCPPYPQGCISAYGGNSAKPPLPRVSRSFESARITMMIHQFTAKQKQDAIIWADKKVTATKYFFPADMRYQLIESITHGLQDAVESTLNELFHVNLVDHPVQPAIFNLFVSELLSTAVNCMPLINQSVPEEELYERIAAITSAPCMEQPALLVEFILHLTSLAESPQDNTIGQIREVIQYIGEHYRDNTLSLSSIAEVFSLNVSVLSTTFKQHTGKNFSVYLEDLRIQEAQRLLRTTDLTITRIAEEVGYLSANSFCRAFRRNTGQNASTYKSLTGATSK